jgi:hypothetical protein
MKSVEKRLSVLSLKAILMMVQKAVPRYVPKAPLISS